MSQFITQLSQAVRQNHSRNRWAAQIVIALSFVAIALGYLVAGSINPTQAADSNKVTVSQPVEHAVFYITPPLDNEGRLTINWQYTDWSNQQVVDIYLQSLSADGFWSNLGAPIVTNLAMDTNPDIYLWMLPNLPELVGEQRRIAVTVKHSGMLHTNYSAIFHIRQEGINFVAPLASAQLKTGYPYELQFYHKGSIFSSLPKVWAKLSYRDPVGADQIITEMFYDELPYAAATKLNYWWWDVPQVDTDFISQVKLELFVDDNGDGIYSSPYKTGTSGEFTVGAPRVDFSLSDINPVLPGDYFQAGELMHLNAVLHFSGDRSRFTGAVNLIVTTVFLSGDTVDSEPVGDPRTLAVLVLADEFNTDGPAAGYATVSTPEFPILSKYLLIKGVIDSDNQYFETNELNNFWPKFEPFRILTLQGFYKAALRLTTNPNQPIQVGDEFNAHIMLDLGATRSGGAQYAVKFNPAYLEVLNMSGNLAFDMHEYDNTTGQAWGMSYISADDLNGDGVPDQPLLGGDNIMIATIQFKALATGNTWVDFARDFNGELIHDSSDPSVVNSVKEGYGDEEILDIGIPLSITIGAPNTIPRSGTYFSRMFDLDANEDSPVGVKSIDNLTVIYGKPIGSSITFGVKFYTADGAGIGSQPYYELTIAESGVGFDLGTWLESEHPGWLGDIGQVRFVMALSTDNALDPARVPWIQSLNLSYELNATEVGLINFVGETNKTAAQGASVSYDLVAVPLANAGAGFVRVMLEVDWNGAVAGNGTKPSGLTVQFIVDGQLTNDVGSIWEFWLDENNENYQPSGYPFILRLTPGMDTPPADYTFHVVGSVFGDNSRTLRRTVNPGVLTVTGVYPGTTDFELSFVGDSNRSVRPGSQVTYLVLVKALNGFNLPVTLTTNISSQFTPAGNVIAGFSPNFPITPTAEGYQVLLNVSVAEGTGNQSHSFTVTGTANNGNLVHTLNGILEVDDQAPEQPAITITITVPTEPDRGDTEPRFYFRLYPYSATTRAARVYQQTGILPDEFNSSNQAVIEVPAGLVTDGQRYVGYIRSTRHLWKKSTTDFTVNSTISPQNYTLTFPTLVTGNVGPTPDASEFLDDDIINSLDYTQLIQEWARIFTTTIADFNNDGVVNSADLNFVFGNNGTNWGQRGDLLINLPN